MSHLQRVRVEESVGGQRLGGEVVVEPEERLRHRPGDPLPVIRRHVELVKPVGAQPLVEEAQQRGAVERNKTLHRVGVREAMEVEESGAAGRVAQLVRARLQLRVRQQRRGNVVEQPLAEHLSAGAAAVPVDDRVQRAVAAVTRDRQPVLDRVVRRELVALEAAHGGRAAHRHRHGGLVGAEQAGDVGGGQRRHVAALRKVESAREQLGAHGARTLAPRGHRQRGRRGRRHRAPQLTHQ